MIFAPLLMKILYSSEFLPSAALLPWFVLGIFFKVISWPMGFILVAKGEVRWFAISETVFNALQVGASVVLLRMFGLAGISYAFMLTYFLYVIALLPLTKSLSGHFWLKSTISLLVSSVVFIIIGFLLAEWTTGWIQASAGCLIVSLSCLISLRGISRRVGSDNRISKILRALPGLRAIIRP
jgi:antigen flippase